MGGCCFSCTTLLGILGPHIPRPFQMAPRGGPLPLHAPRRGHGWDLVGEAERGL